MWEEYNILRMQREGKGLHNKLKLFDLSKLKNLKNLPIKRVSEIVTSVVSRKLLGSTIHKSNNTISGAYANPFTNHRTMSSPCVSRYPDDYKERLDTSSAMKPFVCIKYLVTYIILEL